jgi:MFS family permease
MPADKELKKRSVSRKNSQKGIKFLLRALGHRNYRLFFGGQGVSLIGTWMTRVATAWLVYQMTNSAFLLGLVSFSSQIPILFLAPIAGVLVDRWNRHRVLVVTQTLAMLQSFSLAALALTGIIQVWQIIALNIFQGLINAFDMPTRQAFLIEMVEQKEDLSNAIALNSSMFNGARLIGPSIAGLIIAWTGEGACFLIDGISYIGVIVALLAMIIKPRTWSAPRRKVLQGLKEGYKYAFGFFPIRAILLMIALVSLFGFPYVVLMPVFAKDILHGGPNTLGFLMGATGLGALCGAVFLASRKSVIGLGRILFTATTVFGAGIILFSLSRSIWLSLALLLGSGFGMMVQMACANTLLQTIVEDDKRGRVMSFYSMAFTGIAPFGSLLSGALASKLGAPATNIIGGALCIVGAVIFARNLPRIRTLVRPIYVRMGIIPEVAAGLQSATGMSNAEGR